MKKILFLLVFLTLIFQVVAIDVSVEKLSTFDKIKSYFKLQPFYVSGGDFIPEELNYGAIVDAEIVFKVKLSSDGTSPGGNTHKVDLRVWNGVEYKSMGERGFTQPIRQGDWISFKVGGINTNVIPKSWCNQFLYLQGRHEVWVRGDWYPDVKEVQDIGRFEAFYTTSGGAKLVCPEVNPCPQKSLGLVCYSGDAALQRQNGIVKSDGSCGIDYDITDRCAARGETCENGKCKVTQTIPEGTIMCIGNQDQYKIYTQGSWKLRGCKGEALCTEGKCQEKETKSDCTEDITKSCPDGTEVVSVSCVEGTKVETGGSCPEDTGGETYYMVNAEGTDCEKVDYITDYKDKDSCLKALLLLSDNGNGEDENGDGEDEDLPREEYQKTFSWRDLINLEKYGYYTYGMAFLIIIGITVYALVPKRRRRR